MTMIEERPVRIAESGWHPDPQGEHKLRYHDGVEWTKHVTHYGPAPCEGCSAS